MKKILCALLVLLTALVTVLLSVAAAEISAGNDVAPVAAPTQHIRWNPTQPSTEPPTEPETEPPTEPPTEAPTEPAPIDPHITSVTPVNGGVSIRFTPFEGAAKYRVFAKKYDGSGWKGLGDTATLAFTYNGVTPYKPETFTVRAIGADGKFCSDYDKEGYSYLHLPVPTLTKAECVDEGIKVTWNPVSRAPGYRFYVKTANGWKLLTETTDCTYTDTQVESGVTYTYTVKAFDIEKQEARSYFDRDGISATYIAPPQILSCTPVQDGMKVTWNAVNGAVKYRLFCMTDVGWKTIGNTTATSYTHTDPVMGQEYTYTVRVTDADGRFISGYDKVGVTATCLATPALRKAECVKEGVKVSWEPVEGAQAYRVYVKNGSSWKGIANTTEAYYLDESAVSGNSYTYTVRAIDPETGAMMSYFDRSGVSTLFIAQPQITAFDPVEGGTKVTWSAVSGAVKYRLFYQVEGGWKTIGNTADTSFIHADPVPGREYVYTVRVTDANGKYISSYNAAGWAYRYIAPPAVASVSKAETGAAVEWEPVVGAAAYRLYRKGFDSSWKAVVTTGETSYTDAGAPADALYTYTLRTLDADGSLNSYYLKDTPYYYNGVLADGRIPYGNSTLWFSKGYVRQGYVTVDGKTYYYNSSGTLMKNGVVGSADEGYRYADQSGVIDMTARLAVTWNGSDWNVLDGVAHQVSTEKDRTMFRALKLVSRLTSATDTKAQKLRKCFNYLQTETYEYNPRVPHQRGMDWPIIYANDIFTTNGGNCLSYAAAFAFMAKAIGYDEVYACHSGGHGWTEIGGLIYDSEWQRSNHTYSYYGLSYYTKTDVDYLSVKQSFPGNPWMHIEI